MSDIRGSVQEMALVETRREVLSGLYMVRRSLKLTPSFGAIWYNSLDLGFPEVREASRNNPDSSGTYDETAYHGARSVAIELTVLQDAFVGVYGAEDWDPDVDWNSDAEWITELTSWMSPELRPRLFFKMKGQRGNARFVDLRAGNFSAPITGGQSRPVQMQFINPSGKIYDFDTSTAATNDGRTRNEIRQTEAINDGVDPPFAMPLVFPDAARGISKVLYKGAVANGFIARIYSDPLIVTENPRLTVTAPDGTSRTIGFNGLTIPAGQFIEIDTNERTANLNGNPTLRQNQYLAAPLSWPVFRPGVNEDGEKGINTVDFTVGSGDLVGALAYVETLHYNAYLG